MEWVLQVADEVDDALAALRHGWLGLHAHLGALWGAARQRAGSTPSAPRSALVH